MNRFASTFTAHLKGAETHGYALIAALKRDGLMAADGGEATVYQAVAAAAWHLRAERAAGTATA